jgi:hypothetical protein
MGKVVRSQRFGKGGIFKAHTCGRKGPVSMKTLDFAEKHGYCKGVVKDIVHDSGRGAPVAQIQFKQVYRFGRTNTLLAAPEGMYSGQFIFAGRKGELYASMYYALSALLPYAILHTPSRIRITCSIPHTGIRVHHFRGSMHSFPCSSELPAELVAIHPSIHHSRFPHPHIACDTSHLFSKLPALPSHFTPHTPHTPHTHIQPPSLSATSSPWAASPKVPSSATSRRRSGTAARCAAPRGSTASSSPRT